MLVKPGSILKVKIKPKCRGKAQISNICCREGLSGFEEAPHQLMQSSGETGEDASTENLTCLYGSERCQRQPAFVANWSIGMRQVNEGNGVG